VDGPFFRVLVFLFVGGLFGTYFGGYRCIAAHTYAVAAQHEAATVGRVMGISGGKDGPAWHYVFSVNGVKMDDYSRVCATPLAPGACHNKGPVLVYYSYQPYSNSRLEDFAVASRNTYRVGKPVLAISLTTLVLSCAGMVVLARKDKSKEDPDPDQQKGRSKSDDVPDAIHIVPGE
jgi:hypothetical protein